MKIRTHISIEKETLDKAKRDAKAKTVGAEHERYVGLLVIRRRSTWPVTQTLLRLPDRRKEASARSGQLYDRKTAGT